MTKRSVFLASALFLVSLAVAGASEGSGISPETALKRLKDGNAAFAASVGTQADVSAARRADTAKNGQKPYATVLSCSDSRVPAEYVFSAGVGDVFVIRVAGNVADTDEIGTVEYGAEHLGTPVVLVLGHTGCGAVTAVTRGDEVGGSIPALVDNIVPAKEAVFANFGANTDDATIAKVIEENVWQSIRDLFAHSAIVRELVEEDKLMVVGGIYHLDTGKIDWLGEIAGQKALLERGGEGASEDAGKLPILPAIVFSAVLIAVLLISYALLISGNRPFTSISIKKSLYIAQAIAILSVSAVMVFAIVSYSNGVALPGILFLTAPALIAVLAFAFASAKSIYRTFRELVDSIKMSR